MSVTPSYFPPVETTHELVARYGAFLAQLLVNRNINTLDEAEKFLNPQWSMVHDPFLMKDLEAAAVRLHQAIQNNERTTIYADYDADGIPGSAALAELFDAIKYENYDVYLPHRHDEGYGIHLDALAQIKEKGTTLIISIDVGITGHEAAQWCHENNVDLIITDHHEPLVNPDGTQNLPEPLFLINPKKETCAYPYDMLCGAGVIFKFIQGFLMKYRDEYNIIEGWEKWLLDMIGIATLSDMVPLQNENRVFAYYGLQVIQKTRRPGLQTLLQRSKIYVRRLTEEDITFSITPQINAASRMSHPEDAYNTLQAKTRDEALLAVEHLQKLNTQRKTLVAQTMKDALQKLKKRKIENSIVVGSPDWQAGILGLVASKLVEHYQVPVFAWSEEHGTIKGSCRTAQNIDLMGVMGSVPSETFLQYGGHLQAGGFSCTKESVHFLPEHIEEAVKKQKDLHEDEDSQASYTIDMTLKVDEITESKYQELRKLAPFGVANEKPLFLFKDIIPEKIENFGKEANHFKITFKNSLGKSIPAIAFFKTKDSFSIPLQELKPIHIVGTIELSFFMGKKELRISIIDLIDPTNE
jgi:single-stranded-DNA-specific exonuclease